MYFDSSVSFLLLGCLKDALLVERIKFEVVATFVKRLLVWGDSFIKTCSLDEMLVRRLLMFRGMFFSNARG